MGRGWRLAELGPTSWLKGEEVAVKPFIETKRGRFERAFLVASVVLVQLAWGTALVYLALHFL
jgi:hypothetical protein